MATEQVIASMAGQIGVVVCAAREQFADAVEEYMKGKKGDIGIVSITDKLNIERLFTDAVNSYIIGEVAAIISYLMYDELKNDEVIKRIAPAVLEQYECQIERVPDTLIKKTSDLPEIAKRVLGSETEKSPLVSFLLADISEMPKIKHLRASFDAAILNFMGE
jgi:hypothetical protein